MAREVIVYSQPGWANCHAEKEFLSQKRVPFTDKNIREDTTALEELQKLGYRVTPVTVIDGVVVVGFDRGKLERLLGLSWALREERMAKAWCRGWGQEIEIPAGIRDGDVFNCPNWAGLSLRASERQGDWTVSEVKKASCAVGDEVVILPDNVQPGDVIECHGVRQRVTYEFGAYALVKLEGEWRWRWKQVSGSEVLVTLAGAGNGRVSGLVFLRVQAGAGGPGDRGAFKRPRSPSKGRYAPDIIRVRREGTVRIGLCRPAPSPARDLEVLLRNG